MPESSKTDGVPRTTASAPDFRPGTRILVIEPNPITLQSTGFMFGLCGADVTAVPDIDCALDAIRDGLVPEAVVSADNLNSGAVSALFSAFARSPAVTCQPS